MKVISYSLWGNSDFYTLGMLENCIEAKKLYPDWKVWVYVNDTVPESIKQQLLYNGAQLIPQGGSDMSCWNSMWRFLPSADPSIDVFISRDSDSRLSQREVDLVNEWIKSDKDMHIIRDHKEHGLAVCAGMFGLKKGKLSDLMAYKMKTYRHIIESNKQTPRYIELSKDNMKGIDQDFLEYEIFNEAKGNTYVHVSAGRFDEGDIKINPDPNNNFIGKPIEVNK